MKTKTNVLAGQAACAAGTKGSPFAAGRIGCPTGEVIPPAAAAT